MKKLIGLLLLCLCLAGTATADMENTIPAMGDTIGGFTVTKEEPFDILGGTLVTLTHEKSGGTVVWIANDDTERSYTIGFRTHYDRDTGVPHVFEHAALSGSEKYPDSGMFFSMGSQLYQTYMNAGTSVNWTDYQVASLSDKQLLKMADYILAGVFEPLVLTDRHAMMREAYRYELKDADSDISLTGTVYSEMQGNYYASALHYVLWPQLFPGSWNATCTGGKPGVIEEMTQQDLIDFHSTYYVPSNAVSLLYGDLNLTDYLTLIGSYYNSYAPADVSTADPGYTPFTGYSRVDCDIPASASESADTTLVYAVPLRGYSDTEVYLLGQFLDSAIDNESSAYYDLMMQRFPDCTSGVSLLCGTGCAEPMLIFQLSYAQNVTPEDFTAAVKEGLEADLAEGIHYDVLKTSLKTLKKNLLTVREGSNIGINYSEALLGNYANYGSPSAYLDHINALLNDGEAWLDSGILESAIRDKLLDPADSRLIVMTKRPGSLEEINAAAAKKLTDMKAAMSVEEIQAMIDSTADYSAWVDASGAVSQIDEVKALTVAELPEEVKEFTASDEMKDGVRIVTSDTSDSRLINITLDFDASAVPAEDLVRYSTIVNLLGSLRTDRHTHDEVTLLAEEYGISFSAGTLGPNKDPDTWRPVFSVSISCLREDLSSAVSAAWEILTETKFDEADLIRYYCGAIANNSRYSYSTRSPNGLAMAYARAAVFASDRYTFELDYTPYLRYIESVGKMDDTAYAAEADAWQRILSSLLNKTNLAVTAISGQEGIDEALASLAAYTGTLAAGEIVPADYSTLTLLPKSIAILIPGSANYNLKYVRMNGTGVGYSGSLQAVSALLTDKVLIPVMRYRNGVYTPMCYLRRNSASILAYRDPSIAATYDEVLPALGDTLRQMTLTQDELDSYIINAYSGYAMPVGPISGAAAAASDVLCGDTTFADTKAAMESLRALTPADLAADADIFDALSEKGVIVTAGSSAAIEAEKDRFETVETWYASSDGE